MEMRGNLADIRWFGHKKYIQKGIRFRPEYALLLDQLAKAKGISQREVVESAMESLYGAPFGE